MDVEAYIASGILELFVAGLLSEEENVEVYRHAEEYPKIKLEIESIEAAILALSKTAAPAMARHKGFDDLKVRIGQRKDTTVVKLPKEKTNWSAYLAWTAAILFGAGLYWFYNESSKLQTELDMAIKENAVLEQQIFEARNGMVNSQQMLSAIRNTANKVVHLEGQEVAPEAYARVYWNQEDNKIFIDARGLPELQDGMAYQVWSLKPATPASLGLLENFASDEDKIFAINHNSESEVFGISMELEGGSESPTTTQMYVLGNVSN